MLCGINVLAALLICSVIIPLRQDDKPAPALRSPQDQAVMDNDCRNRQDGADWKFKWDKVPNASRYHLYVIGARAQYPVVDEPTIKKTSYRRKTSGSYIAEHNRLGWQWKVWAMVNGKWGEWSKERKFDVEPLNTDCD